MGLDNVPEKKKSEPGCKFLVIVCLFLVERDFGDPLNCALGPFLALCQQSFLALLW